MTSEKEKTLKFVLLLFLLTLSVFIMIGLWTIDIGTSGIATGRNITNGFWIRDAIQQYHYGLWLVSISAIALGMILAWAITHGKFMED